MCESLDKKENKPILCKLGLHKLRMIHVGKVEWVEHIGILDNNRRTIRKYTQRGRVFECERDGCKHLEVKLFNGYPTKMKLVAYYPQEAK